MKKNQNQKRNQAAETDQRTDFQKNQDNYRQNIAGHSNPVIDEGEEDRPKGKLIYTDVYIVGKLDKTNLAQDQSRQGAKRLAVREAEEALKTPRILGSREFIEQYNKARAVLGPLPEAPPDKPAKRRKKKKPAPAEVEPRGKKGRNKNVGSEPGTRGKAVGLRVIGGDLKGISLKYSGDHRVRPMKDRVRESVFNLMGPLAKGRHVVDLFTGTGALAFEAISRGSLSASLIEIHFPTAKVTRENIETIVQRVPAWKDKIELTTTDVFFWGRALPGRQETNPVLPTDIPWLVFCSPPYDFYIERQEDMLELIRNLRKYAPNDSVFVIEADERFDFELLEADIPPRKRKSYPPAEIGIFMV